MQAKMQPTISVLVAASQLTACASIRGDWQGIQVESRGADNVLDHVVLAFAGSKQWTGSADSAAATWRALAVPYAVTKETRIEAALTIEAGAQLTFFQDAWLHVRGEGSLTAIGSAEAPIAFSSPAGEAVPGYWKGLGISTASTANKLEYVSIRNAGSKSWYGGDDATGALRLDNGVVSITNSTIADIAGWGIDLGSKGSVSDCSGTTFSKVSGDNVKGNPAGVCM